MVTAVAMVTAPSARPLAPPRPRPASSARTVWETKHARGARPPACVARSPATARAPATSPPQGA